MAAAKTLDAPANSAMRGIVSDDSKSASDAVRWIPLD
jgi:hypothetical protein